MEWVREAGVGGAEASVAVLVAAAAAGVVVAGDEARAEAGRRQPGPSDNVFVLNAAARFRMSPGSRATMQSAPSAGCE